MIISSRSFSPSALLEQAVAPWDVQRRRVWPRSFRAFIPWLTIHGDAAVEELERRNGWRQHDMSDIWLLILPFCSREWFAVLPEAQLAATEATFMRAPARIPFWCDMCQCTPLTKPEECPRCGLVRYCSRECRAMAWNCRIKPHALVCWAAAGGGGHGPAGGGGGESGGGWRRRYWGRLIRSAQTEAEGR